ncbi:MAG: hypothetical protein ACO3F2_01025 [Roseiflexaceae bacterium]
MGRTSIIALGITLVLLGWWLIAIESAPRSHADAIMMHLRMRNIPVRQVHVTQPWPIALPFYAYGATVMPYQASVSIQLVSGLTVSGFMVCQSVPFDCRITVKDYQVVSEQITDIRQSPSVWDWVREQWSKLITT